MAFDFDTPTDRRGTASNKWDKYGGRDVIPMWVADMDFRSPPAIIEALHRRAEHGVFGYTHAPDELLDVTVTMLQNVHGWAVQPQWLVWLPGLVTGINVACRAVSEDGAGVLTAVPVYHPFLMAPGLSRRRLIKVPLRNDRNRWDFDFERFEDAITPDTRLLLLCSPHNPVGRVLTREELTTLAEICQCHDIIICSDEIHCDLVLDTDKIHIPTATLDAAVADRTITLMAPSKTYNTAGLGCSFAVIPSPSLRQRFIQTAKGIVPHINAMGYAAALAAYRDCSDWRAALLDYLRDNRDLTFRTVNAMPGLSMGHVEATYLGWIDTRAAELEQPAAFFEAAGVGLSDGQAFGGPGFVRLNFGCPRDQLMAALEKMQQAMERHMT